jgi:hypothetical protein
MIHLIIAIDVEEDVEEEEEVYMSCDRRVLNFGKCI